MIEAVSSTKSLTPRLAVRRLDLSRDLDTLHDWVNRPYAHFWGQMGKSRDELAAIYRAQAEQSGNAAFMACRADTDEPLFLLESYEPSCDELARHYKVKAGDLGLHILMGPATRPQPGLGYQLMAAACEYLFNEAAVQRIVAEPDLRNHKAITRMLQVGFQPLRVIHLPHKTALLVALERKRFEIVRSASAPSRPVLRAWPLRASWHLTLGRILRKLRALWR